MTDALTIVTDITKGLGDVPSIPQAVKAFEGQSLKTKIIESIIILDDAGKIVGLFVPPVAVIANDVGIVIELEEVLDPIAEPVIKRIAQPLITWIEHELDPSPKPAAAVRGNTRPLLLLTSKT